MQGADKRAAEALARGELDAAGLPEAEVALLQYVELLTLRSYRATRESVQQLEQHGWSAEQVRECAYITALFALFNRVADAFGLEDPHYG